MARSETLRVDVYRAAAGSTLADAATRLGSVIGAVPELHESGYFGGDYFKLTRVTGVDIRVHVNRRDDEGYLLEADCDEGAILVYVSGTEAAVRALEPLLTAFPRVRTRAYPASGRRRARRERS